MQEAVLEGRALDLDEVGELEGPLEGARGDALIEHLALLLVLNLRFLAADGQGVLLGLDRQLGLGEAGDREGDPIAVFAGALDIVGRVGRTLTIISRHLVEQRNQTVEADGGTIERGKIESRAHGISSWS